MTWRADPPEHRGKTMFARSLAVFLFGITGFLMTGGCPLSSPLVGGNPRVRFVTTSGDFVIELDPNNAPLTVENFVAYANDGFYDGTIMHRVVPGFLVQG